MTARSLDFDPREIRWIAFDAVGTLLYPDPPVARVYGETARRYGSRLSDDEIRRRFRAAFEQVEEEDFGVSDDTISLASSQPDRLTTNEHRERKRWERIVSIVLDNLAEPENCFAELFAWFGRPSAWRPYPDVEESLRACAAAGFELALASNFDARLHSVCNGRPELAPIKLRVISSEVGYRKPSVYFYGALVEAAGCSPDQILMIGDDEINDVQGAGCADLKALRLDRGAETGGVGVLTSLSDLPGRLGLTHPTKSQVRT